jgi:hypothetical protein
VATFKEIAAADIKTSRSFLNQLVDVIQEDISGSTTRKKYQVFVTGGIGPGVTSSLFQTVYDQDFTLQTANPVFDVTVGLYSGSATVTGSSTGEDSAGKLLFPSQSIMMREKIDIYRQYAQLLLGNADNQFTAPISNAGTEDGIDEAMFVNFKRLFTRDQIKRESFAMRFFATACIDSEDTTARAGSVAGPQYTNLNRTTITGSKIFTDVGAGSNQEVAFGGSAGNIVNAANTAESVGVLFYQQGIAAFDMKKILSGGQHVSGAIAAMNENNPGSVGTGKMVIGGGTQGGTADNSGNPDAKFIPDLMVSASIDDILNHLCSARFSSGSQTAFTFQNITNINSTLIFCRATADEFNYSANPTFTDSSNDIQVIDAGQESTQQTFSFFTAVGLYDASDNLLAVAKLSRPVEKNSEKDLTIRVRLDF